MNRPIYKIREDINKNYIDYNLLSLMPEAVDFLKENPDKINWINLCNNPSSHIIPILEKNMDKIDWYYLSGNSYVISFLKQHKDKINWDGLSYNYSAYQLLFENQNKINWINICLNENPKIIKEIIGKNLDKEEISWEALSQNINDEAIFILKENLSKINWNYLSSNTNPNAILLLKRNISKINWYNLSLNPSRQAKLLFLEYVDIIDWRNYKHLNKYLILYNFDTNENNEDEYYKNFFQLDYKKMSINFQDMNEEILKEVLHPRRVIHNLITYNYDVDDMYY
jgi:hypothetical protein